MAEVPLLRYGDCVKYIEDIPRFAGKPSLSHTREFLDALRNPEKGPRVLHVAGTNGKGSVCAYLQAALSDAGYRTAAFTSPHLERINERFSVDGRHISDEAFVRCFRRVAAAAEEVSGRGLEHPSYFEWLFLMGLCWFAEEEADFVILETGLGGRLDATNVIERPEVAVITAVGLDHTEQLGDTLAKIAKEKAGIIKPGTPLVYDGENREAAAVIRKQADLLDAPATELGADDIDILENDAKGTRFRLRAAGESFTLQIPQRVPYQTRNAALAFLALRAIRPLHNMTDEEITRGFQKMRWPARMEEATPGVVIDGAHNKEAAEQFARAAEGFVGARAKTLVFAAASDKPWEAMADLLGARLSPKLVITTEYSGGRAVCAEKLAERFRAAGIRHVKALPANEEAFDTAMKEKGDGVLFVVGSLYLAGAFRAWIREHGEEYR